MGSGVRIEQTATGMVISVPREAFRLPWAVADWSPIDERNSNGGLSGRYYVDPDAGPGQVASITATVTPHGPKWRTELRATVIEEHGRSVTGVVGNVFTGADTPGKAKMGATRNAHRLAQSRELPFTLIAPPDDWRPGDWVLDAAGAVWVRASAADTEAGRPWARPPGTARRVRRDDVVVTVPSGKVAEDRPVRPLTLLIRDGLPRSPA